MRKALVLIAIATAIIALVFIALNSQGPEAARDARQPAAPNNSSNAPGELNEPDDPGGTSAPDGTDPTDETGAPDEPHAPDAPLEDDLDPIGSPHLPEVQGLTRGVDGILIGSMVFDEPILLKGAHDFINVRSGPGTDTQIVTTISLGQVLRASGVVDGWYEITALPSMFRGFIRSDLLIDYDEKTQYLARTREDQINYQGRVMESTLVDVRSILPEIEYYMIFATPDNFTGRTLYARDVPFLQTGTAEKLKEAQAIFSQDGYRIKVYDAYRPSSVSGILSDIIRDSRYVASAGSSIHNRAAAVDISLVDDDGNELEMPSPMHTFDRTSHRDSPTMSAEARKNMDYMTSVMRRCGFTTVSTEWWHFSDADAHRYPPLDISFRELYFYSVEN